MPNPFSPELRKVLPPQTRRAWLNLAPLLPPGAYLAGGTALAVHLHHRSSRDLDFFVTEAFDTDALAAALEQAGTFAPTQLSDGTLNGVFEGAKVQFLTAPDQTPLDPFVTVAGIPVAGLRDILATKVKVVGDRPELRDYFDLMQIEQRTNLRVEHGLAYYLTRYRASRNPPEATLGHIVLALGYLDDVAEDPGVPATKDAVAAYWAKRQPEIVAALDPNGSVPANQTNPATGFATEPDERRKRPGTRHPQRRK